MQKVYSTILRLVPPNRPKSHTMTQWASGSLLFPYCTAKEALRSPPLRRYIFRPIRAK